MAVDLSTNGQAKTYRHFDRAFIQHRQHARQPEIYIAGLGVWGCAVAVLAPEKILLSVASWNMYFQANNGFPTHDASPGRRLCQSVCRWNCAANINGRSSRKAGAISCIPMGKPWEKPHGIDIAGSPAKLVGTVNKSC